MSTRLFLLLTVAGVLSAAIVSPQVAMAQAPAAAPKGTGSSKAYKAPRTQDGQPDLQGYWSNTSYTSLQRPADVNKPFYTKEEAEAMLKKAAAEEAEQTVPGTVADVHYDFTQFGLDRSQSPLAMNLRTSLIFDPPDGRLPP